MPPPVVSLRAGWLVVALVILLQVVGRVTCEAAHPWPLGEGKGRQEEENRNCKGRGKDYLHCLQRKTHHGNVHHGPPHSVERQAYCDDAFADYLTNCYDPDSARCRKRRKQFEGCVMKDRHSEKHGARNSTARLAHCKEKHWRYVSLCSRTPSPIPAGQCIYWCVLNSTAAGKATTTNCTAAAQAICGQLTTSTTRRQLLLPPDKVRRNNGSLTLALLDLEAAPPA